MVRILCFGDSNTFGYKPDRSGRFDENTRWTGRIQNKLGDNYRIIEEGLCGRTTVFEDEIKANRRGIELIAPLVESHNPLDVLIVMLGTNDCKIRYGATASVIVKGMEQVIELAKSKASDNMKVLIVSPILLGEGVGEEGYDPKFDKRSEEVCSQLAAEYERLAKENAYYYLDAARYATASSIDREHLDATGHERLADAIYDKLTEIFNE